MSAAPPPEDFADIAALLRAQAARRPWHPALLLDGALLAYAELDAAMDHVAAATQAQGLKPGETVALCGGTSLDYLVAMLGCLRAGLALAPLPASAHPDTLAAMAADCGARLLFLDRDAARQLPPRPRQQRVLLGAAGDPHSLQAWMAPPGSVPEPVPIGPRSRFAIIYSSGTTAAPKGIVQSHGMRWAGLRGAAALGYGADSVALVSTPLYSNTTLVGLLPALACGGSVVLMRKFEARRLLELSQAERVSHAMLVPAQYARIMALPDFDAFDLSSYRVKLCTSAPFAPALKAEVARRWPGALVELYGLSEGGGVCALPVQAFPDKLHSVGRPLPGHDMRIVDAQGRELPPGQVGEVVGRSPGLMDGYHGQAQLSQEARWHDAEGRAYIRSGDLGHFDAEGFLVLGGRRKDLIISGGFNVYPGDLERVLLQHPAVAEAAVIGLPSPEWGETPAAFVVLRTGAALAAEELRLWANGRLGRTQRIAVLELRGELPRNAIGKVLKRELRRQTAAADPA